MDPLATPPPTLWATPTFTPRQPARASSNDIKDMSARCGGSSRGACGRVLHHQEAELGLGSVASLWEEIVLLSHVLLVWASRRH